MKLVLMLASLYLAYGIAMVWLHPQFIYPFGPDRFDAPGWTQSVVTNRNVAMAIAEGDDEAAVLFFMGNGGALSYFTYTLDAHVNAGRTIAAMEYPGGGGIPGKPSEVRLKDDALAAYDWLAGRHDGPIVVHGYSMGTGLAQYVAAQRDVAAIILDAPYAKMCKLMTRASWLPACFLPGVQKWNSAQLVPQLRAPVLVQHGTADQLIPMSHGERLIGLMRDAGLQVVFHPIEGATHNNLAGQAGYQARIDAFLNDVLK